MSTTKGRIQSLLLFDLKIAIRNFEQPLSLGLSLLFLVVFSASSINRPQILDQLNFALAASFTLGLLSVSFVRLAIQLGFDQSLGAIKRYSMTPLTKVEFFVAKTILAILLFSLQATLLGLTALLLGWQPAFALEIVVALFFALLAFSALAFAASSIEKLTSSVANALIFLTLFLTSGIIFDLDSLPNGVHGIAQASPSAALTEIVHTSFATNSSTAQEPWLILLLWGLIAPVVAINIFRWK